MDYARKLYKHVQQLQHNSSIFLYKMITNFFFHSFLADHPLVFVAKLQLKCIFFTPLNFRIVHLVVSEKFDKTSKSEIVRIFMEKNAYRVIQISQTFSPNSKMSQNCGKWHNPYSMNSRTKFWPLGSQDAHQSEKNYLYQIHFFEETFPGVYQKTYFLI